MFKRIILYKYLSIALLLFYFLISLIFVFFGKLWQDENWYYAGAYYFSQGLTPFSDFFSHHNPLYYYLYSIPQYFFGPSLLLGRITSLILTLFIGVLSYLISERMGKKYAGLFTLIFLVSNHYSIGWYNMMSFHPLESLLPLLFFYLMIIGLKKRIKYFYGILVLVFLIGVRYPTDVSTLFLFSFLIFIYIDKKSFQHFYPFLLWAIFILGVVFYPIHSDYYKWFYQTIIYPIYNTTIAPKQLMEDFSIISKRFSIIEQIIRNFFNVIIYTLTASFICIYQFFSNRRKLIKNIKQDTIFYVMLGFVIISEAFYQIPVESHAVQRLFHFPVMCIVAALFCDKLIFSVNNKTTKNILIIIPSITVILNIFTQDMPSLRSSWSTAHINQLDHVSDYLANNTPKNAEIFTFQAPFVIEAKRNLSMNMLMGVWQVAPLMSIENCKKYGMVNIEMIIQELNKKSPYALLLQNPGRLEDNNGKGRILIPYRDSIWEVINKNYYLAHTFEMKKGVDPDVNIYFQKK